jgi:uncharacterized RDD family membrane protein YckC
MYILCDKPKPLSMLPPINAANIKYFLYAGFAPRLGSLLLDFVFVLPAIGINLGLSFLGVKAHLFSVLFNILFFTFYHVYLVAKFGGTPGKLVVGIKVVKLNFEPVGIKEAALRYSVEFGLLILSSAMMIYAVCKADESYYISLPWLQRAKYLQSFYPTVAMIHLILSNIWVWGELIVLLTNEKKRAIHDFIAGTVIVDTKYLAMMQEVNEAPTEITE